MWSASRSSLGLNTRAAPSADQCPGRRVLASQCKAFSTRKEDRTSRSASGAARQLFARSQISLRPGLESSPRVVRSTMCAACLPSQGEIAVVLVDHGSKRKEANDMLEEFAALYRSMSNRQRVEIAHMELAEPSIGTAVAKCASDGIKKVVVAPYFLSRGRHITSDIPALVAEAQRAHPELECVIAEPIGIDPLMAQVIENRVTGALQSS